MWSKVTEPLKQSRFFKGETPQPSPYALSQRRVFILPTRTGILFGGLLFVMLLGAINYSNSLGFMLTFLLASLNIISMLYTYRNLLHLKVSVRQIPPTFSGDAMKIPVLLDNSGHAARYTLNFDIASEPPVYSDIAANGWAKVELSKIAPERGMHNIDRITIHTVFPLGIFHAWSPVRLDQQYLVYPKPAKSTGLPEDVLYRPKQTGDKGRGSDDFAGFRNYHVGDSLRHINWNAVAREQGFHTKQFGGDRSDEIWLDWRLLEHLGTEQRLSQLARWVIDAEHTGLSYGLWIPGEEFAPGHGDAHKHKCLKALALFS